MNSVPYNPNEVIDAIASGLLVMDHEQRIVTWNRWMEKHSGRKCRDVIGQTLITCFPEMADSRIAQAIDFALSHRMAALISPALHQPILKLYQQDKDQKTDRRMQQLINVMPVAVSGKPGCMLQIQDMTATVRRERRLRSHASQLKASSYMDALTGIGNRRKFDETIHEEFHRALRDHTPLSLIMIDIDYFKAYNDLYGHQNGDTCLTRVAKLLREVLRQSGDAACRYGGEEFAVVLPGTNEAGACMVAERLRLMVESQLIRHDNSKVAKYVTISLGLATLNNAQIEDSQTLIHAADMALYHAKADGRNRTMCFSMETGNIRACS